MAPLLQVQDLKVWFRTRRSLRHSAEGQFLKAVDGVTFDLHAGETLGLVGESGCGKSTLGRAIVRLIRPTSGQVIFEGQDIAGLRGRGLVAFRRGFQMIFQDPYGSLDPRRTVQESIEEGLRIHHVVGGVEARVSRVTELLQAVGLDPAHLNRYPHEFSGGQRQRIGMARALAVEPKLIVCDEPVSALDVSVQAQIINLLMDLQHARGVAYLFIAHDLAVVEHISRRIMVMYLGRIVESGPAPAITGTPLHPYTRALLSAVPVLDPVSQRKRVVLSGDAASPINPPSGCPFHPRCPIAQFPRCREEVPRFEKVAPGHWAACHFAKENGRPPTRRPPD